MLLSLNISKPSLEKFGNMGNFAPKFNYEKQRSKLSSFLGCSERCLLPSNNFLLCWIQKKKGLNRKRNVI